MLINTDTFFDDMAKAADDRLISVMVKSQLVNINVFADNVGCSLNNDGEIVAQVVLSDDYGTIEVILPNTIEKITDKEDVNYTIDNNDTKVTFTVSELID